MKKLEEAERKRRARERSQKYRELHGAYYANYYNTHKQEKKDYNILYQAKNKDKIVIRNKDYKIRKRNEWINMLNQIFGELKCSRCEYSKCFQALDFHHLNPRKKTSTVAQMLRKKITKDRLTEVKDCIILCSNCHRELHVTCINKEETKND